jgi:hypothetical protein
MGAYYVGPQFIPADAEPRSSALRLAAVLLALQPQKGIRQLVPRRSLVKPITNPRCVDHPGLR